MNNKVPVLVLAFNRPDHVRKVMEAIAVYQPDKLYLACDGPRENKEGERGLVGETQRVMKEAVTWPCEVKSMFREKNLGCAYAVYGAITWFFDHEEYGVIIEDDVIVGKDFFKLCEDLLPRYAKEEKIMEIAAQNHSFRKDIPNTYVYTETAHCWGWATWRRAWDRMDMSMSAAKSLSKWYLMSHLGMFRGFMMDYYFKTGYQQIQTLSSWATRWYLSILANRGLIICPGVNLAINIGMDGGAHYDKGDKDPYENLEIDGIVWPLVYNDSQKVDRKQFWYDKKDFRKVRAIGLKKKLRRLL